MRRLAARSLLARGSTSAAAPRLVMALALTSWSAAPLSAQGTGLGPAPASLTQADYAARRDSLLAHIDSGVVIAPGARESVEHYPPFRQHPSFRYLTGFLQTDATLILVKRGGTVTGTIFIEPPAPRTEFYMGTRVRYDELARRLGLAARSKDDVNVVLDSLAATHLPYYFVSDAEADEFVANDSLSFGRALARRLGAAHPGIDIRDATPIIDALRAKKSAAEIALVKRAADISGLGHRAAMQALAPDMNEFEIQAIMEYTFRRNGADRPSYASIVGSGPNSTTLHYDRDDRVMRAGEVLVMDVAAEYQGYAADITRTLPVGGTFTPDQRVIYQIVRDAQGAGERQVKAGVPVKQEVDSIFAVVGAGLARLGLIDSVGATVEAPAGFCRSATTRCPQVSLFFPHGPGHGLGLDVHDPAQWYTPPGQFGVGDVFTIEPGIYIRPGILDILPDSPANRAFMARVRPLLQRYANIGVRIEDNYVVTPTGLERLSMVPREINEIEAIMRHHLTTPPPRDAQLVGSYPGPN
jgi:Xaa-Pro aminopeptidase